MTPEETAFAIDYLQAVATDAKAGRITITKFQQREDNSSGLSTGLTVEWDNNLSDDDELKEKVEQIKKRRHLTFHRPYPQDGVQFVMVYENDKHIGTPTEEDLAGWIVSYDEFKRRS